MRTYAVAFITTIVGIASLFPVAPVLAAGACDDDTTGKTEEELKADLAQCNAEIAQWQGILNGTRNKVTTIDSDVKALTAKIKAAEATIKSKNIAISQLSEDINERSEKIQDLEDKINEGKESLAQLIRRTNEIDDSTLAEVVLNSKNLSEFFSDLDSFFDVQRGLEDHFRDVRQTIAQTEEERERLGEMQDKELDAKYVIETNKKTITKTQAEKQQLLAATKQEAKSYEQIVKDRQAKANQINAALFRLRGVDGGGIPFKEALAYAKAASSYTGVRAAFILAILRQESNLGVNVGQCLLVNPQTGAGKGKNTGTPFANVMKPDRDIPYFLDLMKRLGRDPYATPVSCPQSVGYGGAMGPTQFIPSTWRSYEPRIAQAFGQSVADPWDPESAIMATALYLEDMGAARGGYTAEREAAARYYAGGGWATYGLGYAASVLAYAEQYQNDIDFLSSQ
ncbi:MAG TPA: lytic murein transglycosylase [Candidatus Paceibacterota bacterium]|nr:lytic murein transglycosylase [Candidatus Paceibacterota bacterium]